MRTLSVKEINDIFHRNQQINTTTPEGESKVFWVNGIAQSSNFGYITSGHRNYKVDVWDNGSVYLVFGTERYLVGE